MNEEIILMKNNGVNRCYVADAGLYAVFTLPRTTPYSELVFIDRNGYDAIIEWVCEKDNIGEINEQYVRENYLVMSLNDLLKDHEKLIQCIEKAVFHDLCE